MTKVMIRVATVAIILAPLFVSGCTNGVLPEGASGCISGEVLNPADCNPACMVGSTQTVCVDGAGACRLRPGATCSAVAPAPCGGAPVGAYCTICGVSGITACVADAVRCIADSTSVEICGNGVDDNCNGAVDEDCGVCTNGETRPCGTNVGTCANGVETCSGGSWGSCEGAVGPSAETCDGVDNNCDGAIDEGCLCTNGETRSCGSNIGVCSPGTMTCSGGSWGSCVGGITPRAEVCGNVVDDNCNGAIDEDCGVCSPGASRSCATACGTVGTQTCSSSRFWNTCTPGAETCNGIDDNCDGVVDEGCGCVHGSTRSCGSDVGVCASGTETCSGGSWGSCIGAITPRTEICNGVDDDCNGAVDEGCSSCTPTNGGVEICDGVDNDCDGVVDEAGVCDSCGGAFVGNEICVSFGYDMPSLATYGGTTVGNADITLFGCDGTAHTVVISATTREACLPLSGSCTGWLATTYSEGSFSDLNNIGSWYSSSGASYSGMRADNPTLSGTLASTSQIRVFARTAGRADRELTNRSWIVPDPSGALVPSYSATHVGERVLRLMVPVREECTTPGVRPPDRY